MVKKKLIYFLIFCFYFVTINAQTVTFHTEDLVNLKIVGECDDLINVRIVSDKIILALINHDYMTLSENCASQIRITLDLGFSTDVDTVISKEQIFTAKENAQLFRWYRYPIDSWIEKTLSTVLSSLSPEISRLSILAFNSLYKGDGSFMKHAEQTFGECIIAEYFMDDDGIDWHGTVLVLKKENNEYKLVGICPHVWEP